MVNESRTKFRLTTTLSDLAEFSASRDLFKKLIKHIGVGFDRHKPINLLTILESNGPSDTIWSLQATCEDSWLAYKLIRANTIKADILRDHYHKGSPLSRRENKQKKAEDQAEIIRKYLIW